MRKVNAIATKITTDKNALSFQQSKFKFHFGVSKKDPKYCEKGILGWYLLLGYKGRRARMDIFLKVIFCCVHTFSLADFVGKISGVEGN